MQLVCMKYEVEEGAAETVDETDLDYKDTELVISQAGCPRAVAITALKRTTAVLSIPIVHEFHQVLNKRTRTWNRFFLLGCFCAGVYFVWGIYIVVH
jgi:hypothetical protein